MPHIQETQRICEKFALQNSIPTGGWLRRFLKPHSLSFWQSLEQGDENGKLLDFLLFYVQEAHRSGYFNKDLWRKNSKLSYFSFQAYGTPAYLTLGTLDALGNKTGCSLYSSFTFKKLAEKFKVPELLHSLLKFLKPSQSSGQFSQLFEKNHWTLQQSLKVCCTGPLRTVQNIGQFC